MNASRATRNEQWSSPSRNGCRTANADDPIRHRHRVSEVAPGWAQLGLPMTGTRVGDSHTLFGHVTCPRHAPEVPPPGCGGGPCASVAVVLFRGELRGSALA